MTYLNEYVEDKLYLELFCKKKVKYSLIKKSAKIFVTNTRKLKIIFMFYTIYLLKNKPFTNFNLDKTLILNS